jgi:hypothetical protein
MEKEYRLVGKGNIPSKIPRIFSNLTNKIKGSYNCSRNSFCFNSFILDSSALYSTKGQKMIIKGNDFSFLRELIDYELNKNKIRMVSK